MRKIKITALVLAVLMVVTAFAGCASKSAVTNLDDKVNDLDGKIKDQSEALAGITSTLADIQNALKNQTPSSDLDDIKKDVEENKKSFEDIQKALEALNKQLEDLKDKTDAVTGDKEDVKKAISQAGAKIDALRGAFEDEKANYTAEDVAAIRAIFGDAQASISACITVAAVNAALDAMNKALGEHKAVNTRLYDSYVALVGNITSASAAKVNALVEQLDKAKVHYKGETEDLTKYEYESEKTIDLVKAVKDLKEKQFGTGENDLPRVTERATALSKKIDALGTATTVDAVTSLLTEYKVWEMAAKELSPENVKLVSNYGKLETALESALNVNTATQMFKVSVSIDKYDSLASKTTFTYGDGKFTSEIYAKIDAEIATWAKTYNLNDAAVEFIINNLKNNQNYYATYKKNRDIVKAFENEYKSLIAADGVFTSMKALQAKTLGSDALAAVETLVKNANALTASFQKADNFKYPNSNEKQAVRNANYKAMFELAGFNTPTFKYYLKPNNIATGEKDGFAAYYLNVYKFADTKMENFLKVTYVNAMKEVKAIEDKLANFKVNQAQSIEYLLKEVGGFVKLDQIDGNRYVENVLKYDAVKDSSAKTINAFIVKYSDISLPYNLSSLIDATNAKYEETIVKVEEYLATKTKLVKNLDDQYKSYKSKDVKNIKISDYEKLVALANAYEAVKTDVSPLMKTSKVIEENGSKVYVLTDLLDTNTFKNLAKKDGKVDLATVETQINKLKARSESLIAASNLVVSAYEMLDKIHEKNSSVFTVDQTKAAELGVTSLTAEKYAKDTEVPAAGLTVKAGKYLWTVNFVVFNGKKFVEKTVYSVQDNGTDADNADDILYGIFTTEALGDKADIAKDVYTDAVDVLLKVDPTLGYKNKLLTSDQLAELAIALENKFNAFNGATYDKILKARVGFAYDNNGYGFGFIKSYIAKVALKDASLTDTEKAGLLKAASLEELQSRISVLDDSKPDKVKDIVLFAGSTVESKKISGYVIYKANASVDPATAGIDTMAISNLLEVRDQTTGNVSTVMVGDDTTITVTFKDPAVATQTIKGINNITLTYTPASGSTLESGAKMTGTIVLDDGTGVKVTFTYNGTDWEYKK